MSALQKDNERKPKTEFDERFLKVARQVMHSRGIKSDRAISLALGKHPDFVNRVSKGLQSATAEAWDKLLRDYPEAQNVTTNNVMSQGGGQAVGTVHGDNYGEAPQDIDHFKPKHQAGTSYYEWNNLRFVSAETHDALKREIELLERQLADKERIIKLLEKNQQQ